MRRILITKFRPTGAAGATDELRREVERLDVRIGLEAGGGFVAGVSDKDLRRIDEAGMRWVELRDPDVLRIGRFTIDTSAGARAPRTPSDLRVPDEQAEEWTHRLIQLAAPPTPEWVADLEEMGIHVVEPIGPYGLFVLADAKQLEQADGREYIAWTGLFQPAYRIHQSLVRVHGRLDYVAVDVVPAEDVNEVRDVLESLGATVQAVEGPPPTNASDAARVRCELDAEAVPAVARIPSVRWLERQGPDVPLDERSSQIVAENLDGAAPPNTAPVTGYQGAIAALGLNGAGVRIGIADTGVDNHDNATMHGDLAGRFDFFADATAGVVPVDVDGHGTHVAGIAGGNATLGDTDPQTFLLGQGVAPGARLGSVNGIGSGAANTFSDSERVRRMVINDAHVMNNSWGQTNAVAAGYTSRARTVDQLVRDPDPATPAAEQLVLVCAAGNAGGAGATSIINPWEAKNPIVVGNSLNFRPGEGDVDDIRGIRSTSSRGPAVDGRNLPTVVAPGTDIVSARSTADKDANAAGVQRPGAAYTDTGAAVHQDYTQMSGTSMAAPHVAGLCALLIEWWRNRTGGTTPSTALLKAFLVNGCEDLVGGPDGAGGTLTNIPNGNQGWGRVSLENMVLQAPVSDRGPKVFADQSVAFTASGEEFSVRVGPAESARPMRITLAYTDAPGAVGANPALVNNLNLEVEELSTGTVFRGNVFANGFSAAGGSADTLNNVECVYVQNPIGAYEVRVLATSVVTNASPPFDMVPWQDFALVLDNVEEVSEDPAKVALVLDRSGSMVTSGYVDVTKQASKQFVDLSVIDDELGVVSFGSTGKVEFPAVPPDELQTVTGPAARTAARNEIDGIAFGGCTFMGEGIQRGGDMLASETGRRGIVLFSDGYDNKGCDKSNPAKPSALDAAGTLPDEVPIHSCAMGPASDQALLEQLATSTEGRYYFMPAIDDLFEIYNYVRGLVTQDGVVANETGDASSSSVPAFVEALAERATFTCAWHDPSLRFTSSTPKKSRFISVRLRDPRGRLVHPAAAFVRRRVGDGYVIFDVPDPAPGLWRVEVETAQSTHTRYTVGAFVRSPIRVLSELRATRVSPGSPIVVAVTADPDAPITRLSATASVSRPLLGLPAIRTRFKARLGKTRGKQFADGDRPPGDIAKLLALHPQLLKEGTDVFARRATRIGLSASRDARRPMTGRVRTTEPGSYNVRVRMAGVAGDSKFVRRDLLSAYVA